MAKQKPCPEIPPYLIGEPCCPRDLIKVVAVRGVPAVIEPYPANEPIVAQLGPGDGVKSQSRAARQARMGYSR